MADGSVVLVEIQRQTLSGVRPDGRTEVIAELGGGPNGCGRGADGGGGLRHATTAASGWAEAGGSDPAARRWRTDYKTGYDPGASTRRAGAVTTVYDGCDGRASVRGPNDIVFDASGGFWFTDLGKSDGDSMHMGHLLYAKPDGSMIKRVREGMITPNGVGLSPDEKTVYVAETHTSRVWGFGIVGPGEIAAAGEPVVGRQGAGAAAPATSCWTAWPWRPRGRSAAPPW